MQTFLPYPSFEASAKVLDNGRLGNQCYRECKTLAGGHWENHPASKMWRGHERSLCEYALALVDEMERRGRWKPEVVKRWREYFSQQRDGFPETGLPAWVGDEEFHAAHRSNLLRKDPVWYGQFGWTEPPDLPYVWPEIKMTLIPPAGEAAEIRPSQAPHPNHRPRRASVVSEPPPYYEDPNYEAFFRD